MRAKLQAGAELAVGEERGSCQIGGNSLDQALASGAGAAEKQGGDLRHARQKARRGLLGSQPLAVGPRASGKGRGGFSSDSGWPAASQGGPTDHPANRPIKGPAPNSRSLVAEALGQSHAQSRRETDHRYEGLRVLGMKYEQIDRVL